MRNKNRQFSPVSSISERFTRGGYLSDCLSENQYYRQMAEDLKKHNIDLVSDNPLETLYNHICYLNNLFRVLRRPWHVEVAEIQKACAYYLAYAKLPKEESEAFTGRINDFISSVCYLTEWNEFVCKMQQFFYRQEKELMQVFEKQKQETVSSDIPETEETTYCLTVGESELYGVTRKQIEELHKVIGLFIEREKVPFECKTNAYKEHPISINKSITFSADEDDCFVEYSLYTFESHLSCMSADQMKRVAEIILEFLGKYGENGKREVHWEVSDAFSDMPDEEIYFNIKEDSRKHCLMAEPYIRKRIDKEEEQETEITYDIDINEEESQSLSFHDFISVYRKLGEFLKV